MKIWLWFMKQMVTVMLVCFVTMTMTIVIINAYTEQIMGSIGLQLDEVKLTYASVIAHITGQGHTIKHADKHSAQLGEQGQAGQAEETEREHHHAEGLPVTTDPQAGKTDAELERANTVIDGQASDDEPHDDTGAIPVWGQQKSDDIAFSMEQFNIKREQLSSDEKLEIFAIVIDNIPPEEVQALSTMMEDGLTHDELERIETMLKTYLNDEQYEQMMGIIVDDE